MLVATSFHISIMTRKRVSALRSGTISEDCASPSVTTEATILPFLDHITKGCSVRELDPSACVPLFLSRPRSRNAVLKLRALLTGEYSEHFGDTILSGMVSGTPTSIVVPLLGSLARFVDSYLEQKYPDEADREMVKESYDEWFGVIDGCQLVCALQDLQDHSPSKFRDFKWRVIVVRHGLDISEYRMLSIVQNERNKQVYHYESTLYDVLRRLRDIYNELYAKEAKADRRRKPKADSDSKKVINISNRAVARMYDGGKHDKNTTIRQAVSIATRLSERTIEAIGSVFNKTCPELILKNKDLNAHQLSSTDSIMAKYDCRLFKRFVCLSTLRGPTQFMNAVKDGNEDAQVNAIFRAKHWCEKNQFRPITTNILNDMFTCSMFALKEESKFLDFIGDTVWPPKMETTRDNLLRSTISDKELRKHNEDEDNKLVVLPSLWSSFERMHPARALSVVNADESDDEEEGAPTLPEKLLGAEGNVLDEEEEKRKAAEEAKRLESERCLAMQTRGDELLRDSGIETYRMNFSHFFRDEWKEESPRVDMILSSVPPTIKDDLLDDLPDFCFSVLKPGSYIFLIVSHSQFYLLQRMFSTANFKVCPHQYSILYEVGNTKRSRSVDFPLDHGEIAILVKTNGKNPEGFVPEFALGNSEAHCHSAGLYASITNVKQHRHKLKRPTYNTPMDSNEKSPELFSHFVRLFCPPGGTVMDPFGGALTTSLACIETNRKCVAMDQEGELMKYALGRLRIFVTPGASMDHLQQYTEVIDVDAVSPSSKRSDHPSSDTNGLPESSEKRRRIASSNKYLSPGEAPTECGSQDTDGLDNIRRKLILPNDDSAVVSFNTARDAQISNPPSFSSDDGVADKSPNSEETTALDGANTLIAFRDAS